MSTPVPSVEVHIGPAALDRLEDRAFTDAWQSLHAGCPWATSFQSFAFADCWYRLFEPIYEPVVVEGRDEQGSLVGLMTLARRRSGATLVGAGSIHAEYQTWLSTRAWAGPFMLAAIDALERAYPRGRLFFNYLSRDTPLDWVETARSWPPRIHLRQRSGGMIDLSDADHLEASLRKGHNRSRLNTLRRSGDVHLQTIDTVDELLTEMDEIAVLCDLRQGAVNDSLPFARSPLKRPLHVGLMERGLLHATVLRVGSRMASIHLDMKDRDEVLIYLITHAPTFARQSPGSLHILMLARELAAQGVARYDLSPGGGYKDRYSTMHESIYRMTVQFGLAQRVAADLSGRGLTAATSVLATVGQTPRSASDSLAQIRARIRTAVRPNAAAPDADPDVVLVRLPRSPEAEAEVEGSTRLAAGRLADLLAYEGRGSVGPLRRFLQLALHRLEAGHTVLTGMTGAALGESWWVARPGGPTTADPADLSGATDVLVYDPYRAAPDGRTGSPMDGLQGLRSTLGALAPEASVVVALPVAETELIDQLVGHGAIRLATIEPKSGTRRPATAGDLDPSADDAALDALAKELMRGWPKDHPRTD